MASNSNNNNNSNNNINNNNINNINNSNNNDSNNSNNNNDSNNSNNNNNNNSNNNNDSNNNFNNNVNIVVNRRRRHRQHAFNYLQSMEMPIMLPLPMMPMPMPIPMPMTMPIPIPATMPTTISATMPERYGRQPMLLRARRQFGGWGAGMTVMANMANMANFVNMTNEGQAGDVGNIGDNNHVVGIPTVAPANLMAHRGGGDAEIIYVAPLAPHHRGAGDGVQGDTGNDGMEAAQQQPQQRVIQPLRRETLEQRRERSVQQILRLCDFIQQQLATIAAQIDAYERKLAQHNAQSQSPPEPDGDVI